jgi:N-methylhydantoinase A
VTTFRVGIDVGGTFTDIIFLTPGGDVLAAKVLSTPDDYGRAIVEGLQAVLVGDAVDPAGIAELIHGTTIATNTILEHKGARTGLITTEGFADVLEIRRLRMPRLYDLAWEKPPVLVPRDRRLEVSERIDYRGEVVRPLDEAHAAGVIDHLLGLGVQSVAICLLNAYANPAHEERLRALLAARARDLPVCLSSDVLPEIKEYERTSTTVVNAYVLPVVERYLRALGGALRSLGIRAPLLVMQSNGGTMGAEAAAERPIHIIESGPAAGVVGARELARQLGYLDLLAFDMGGTTAKASIIENGEVRRVTEMDVGGGINLAGRLLRGGGYHVRVPAIDIAEVGAGGGSVVRLDPGGGLRVGPESSGAAPGPVCYGRGGTVPTVTDANVVLGFLNPEYLVGGALRLDRDRAAAAIAAQIAEPLGLQLEDAAWGVHVLANATMARAVRSVSSERGRDVRRLALMAFGGNGPVHGITLAQSIGIPRVVVPPVPGLFSALGLLFPNLEHHHVRTYKRRLDAIDLADLEGAFGRLEDEGLRALEAEGYPAAATERERFVDMRYLGENSELTVRCAESAVSPETPATLRERFGAEHERNYGYRSDTEVVEVVNIRVVVRGVSTFRRVPERLAARRGAAEPAAGARRPMFFGREHGWMKVPLISRAQLRDVEAAGPLAIEEYDSTVIVPPDCRATLDAWDNAVVMVGGRR